MRQPLPLIVVLVAALGALPSFAEEQTLVLEPDASEVRFTLGATLHTVHGTIRLQRGEIRFDTARGSAAGQVVLDVRSAETGNAKRDRDMHRKVLESEQYPEIAFLPQAIRGDLPSSGAGELTLSGSIRIHGTEHPLELPVRVHREDERITATVEFVLPYVEWGMKDPSKLFLRVKKFLDVTLEVTGTLGP
jgi:polyisoprenoid-binding protein YceI